MIRTEIDSMPQELDEVTRRVMQLEIEEAALKKEKDKASKERLEELRKELADLKAKADAHARAVGGREGGDRGGARRCASEIEQVRRQIEEAERDYDLNQAAELRHGQLPELERQLQRGGGAARRRRSAAAQLLREEVTEEEIAEIVSRWTGIPVTRLVEGEREKLLRLDEILHQRVVGQDEAVQLVADAVHPRPRRHQGPAAADRLVHLPRPHRRRQDRARQDAGRRRSSTARRTSSAST